ncbi:hypothetical protein ISU91_18140, partial [Leptospira borgpetersenii serovar Hardjo-bovis]|nr:hypothetical protein [Leptospira borgpetersenii serovar Hardjo-bovis]
SYDVAIGNDRAAIVWNHFVGSATLMSSSYPNGFPAGGAMGFPNIESYCASMWGGYGSCYYVETKTYQANARILRLDTGAFQGGTITIWSFVGNQNLIGYPYFYIPTYQIDIAANANDNNHLVYAWNVRLPSGGDSHTVYSSVYNLTTGTKIGSDQTLISEATRPVDTLQVAAATGRGMVLWRRNDGVIL